MKTNKFTIIVFGLNLFYGCGVDKSNYDKIKAENDSLKIVIDEYKNGETRLIALIDKAYSEKDYISAKDNIVLLSKKHPQSIKNALYKKYLVEIQKYQDGIIKEQKKLEKEKYRLDNINNTGIWRVGHFVDEFGAPTKNAYIQNTDYIKGTFSNSATQDSRLNVTFLIDNANDIAVQLYEYAGNNPVKGYSRQTYTVRVRDNDDKRYTLSATNYSDRLSFGSSASLQLHNIFMKGGRVQLAIKEDETPTTEYNFEISNASWYDNAFRILKSM